MAFCVIAKTIGLFFLFFSPTFQENGYFCTENGMKTVVKASSMEDSVRLLVDWYEYHRRPLPWRETRDAYAIWVSEIILQQTRVAQGLAYYRRFLDAFPTLESLAAADEEAVLRLWQGLGYYSRARNMHAAARQMVAGGGFPRTAEGIRNIKGVGDYTAAAIGSFAFDLPLAAVDGNVMRVLSRLYAIDTPIDSTTGRRQLKELAQSLLPTDAAAIFNQAMMEFGALQCVPSSPDCAVCPLAEKCLALAEGRVGELPVKGHRTKVRDRWLHYFLVETTDGDGRPAIYLHKRSEGDIWCGLYELPVRELDGEQEEPLLLPVRRVQHQLSHQLLHATLYRAEPGHPSLPSLDDCRLVPTAELDAYAMPRLMQLLMEE